MPRIWRKIHWNKLFPIHKIKGVNLTLLDNLQCKRLDFRQHATFWRPPGPPRTFMQNHLRWPACVWVCFGFGFGFGVCLFAPTPVAGLFSETENRPIFPKINFLEGNFKVSFICNVTWIHKSSNSIFNQSMFLSIIWEALFEKEPWKIKPRI